MVDVKITPIGSGGSGLKSAGGFLRYVQYRDKHLDGPPRDVDAALRYVAHRDRSASRGLLFGPEGPAGDQERRALQAYIGRSIRGVPPPERRPPYSDRACYRIVISPADSRGLDLQALTRSAVESLAKDLGPSARVPPWIAAQHRNTDHPHVHLVVAARREVAQGRYRTVVISRQRLERIKQAVDREIVRQRGNRVLLDEHRRGDIGRRHRGHRTLKAIDGLARSHAVAAERALRDYEHEVERELDRSRDDEVAHRSGRR